MYQYYYYFKIYNTYNDTEFINNIFNGTISATGFFSGIINLSISYSNRINPLNKEIYKALVSRCIKN